MIKLNYHYINFKDRPSGVQQTQAEADAIKEDSAKRNKELGVELAPRDSNEWIKSFS